MSLNAVAAPVANKEEEEEEEEEEEARYEDCVECVFAADARRRNSAYRAREVGVRR